MTDDSELRPVSQVPLKDLPVELQSHIGEYLDRESLHNAIRVNTEWFDRLIDLLWHTAPLQGIYKEPEIYTTRSRCHYYAQKIRIGPMSPPNYHLTFSLRGREFRSIERLTIEQALQSRWSVDHTHTAPFRQPTLQSLIIKAPCTIDSSTLSSIRKCTGLHTIYLGDLLRLSDAAEFLGFFEDFPTLRSLQATPW